MSCRFQLPGICCRSWRKPGTSGKSEPPLQWKGFGCLRSRKVVRERCARTVSFCPSPDVAIDFQKLQDFASAGGGIAVGPVWNPLLSYAIDGPKTGVGLCRKPSFHSSSSPFHLPRWFIAKQPSSEPFRACHWLHGFTHQPRLRERSTLQPAS